MTEQSVMLLTANAIISSVEKHVANALLFDLRGFV